MSDIPFFVKAKILESGWQGESWSNMGQLLSNYAYYREPDITFPWAMPRHKRLVAGLPPQAPGSIPGQVMWVCRDTRTGFFFF
jgi:hypothetical protein